jgi:predicted Zn-dependent peptidase
VRRGLVPLAVFWLLTGTAVRSQETPASSAPPDNPFGGFETHVLPNGFRIWFKHMPGQENVAASVTVHVGADQDPPGKEQLAHFVEHMLFADHQGLTGQQIKKQIEDRGGVWNGFTSSDRTLYFVRLKKEHALAAIDWLARLVSPHDMTPEVVERERQPVEVEVAARPRELFDWIFASYVNPPALRLPDLWQREFGIQTRQSRDEYSYRSLRSITPEDLRQFYERYYSPRLMALTVIGDVDRRTMLDLAADRFGQFRQRATAPAPPIARDAGRYRHTFAWAFRSNIAHTRGIRFATLSATDEVMLTFISRFLTKRLGDRLRFGDRKAVYGISAGLIKRGTAAYLSINGTIRPEEFEFARQVIQEELKSLKAAGLAPDAFENERSTLVQQLRVATATPEALENWAGSIFFDRRRHHDFPDVLSAFERVTQAELASFASRHLTLEREFGRTVYPFPLSQGLFFVLALSLLFGTVRLMRRALVRPVDMTRIRYVARVRMPRLWSIATGVLWLATTAIAVRLLVFGYELAGDRVLVTRDSFLVQWSAFALMAASVVALIVLALSLIPSKVLVFDDRLLVKYVAYRSAEIPFDRIAGVSLQRFRAVWLSRRLWTSVPLKLGLLSQGILLEQRKGRSYYFDVRNREELLDVLSVRSPAGSG